MFDNNEKIKKLYDPSDEQIEIINNVFKYNVVVDSVSGSGKTTTVLHIAKRYSNKNILLLTYNKRLRQETKERTECHGFNNLEVHTYHSFYYSYYDNSCKDDNTMVNIFSLKLSPKKPLNYDMLIVDECQDMTCIYFEASLKMLKDNGKQNIPLCFLGDAYQSIYGFNNADPRFITKAKNIYNTNNFK